MTEWDAIAALASTWDDGGLWDDIQFLADLAWQQPGGRHREWHHLVMAVGNFKRQNGRRLCPASPRAASAPGVAPPAVRGDAFEYPPDNGGGLDVVGREDMASWEQLQRNLSGAAAATTTTLLAALWPDHHFVLDWRVLYALIGLSKITAPLLDPPGFATALPMTPKLSHYLWAHTQLQSQANAAISVTALERGLYMLSRRVRAEKDRGWAQYGETLIRALHDRSSRNVPSIRKPERTRYSPHGVA